MKIDASPPFKIGEEYSTDIFIKNIPITYMGLNPYNDFLIFALNDDHGSINQYHLSYITPHIIWNGS